MSFQAEHTYTSVFLQRSWRPWRPSMHGQPSLRSPSNIDKTPALLACTDVLLPAQAHVLRREPGFLLYA